MICETTKTRMEAKCKMRNELSTDFLLFFFFKITKITKFVIREITALR